MFPSELFAPVLFSPSLFPSGSSEGDDDAGEGALVPNVRIELETVSEFTFQAASYFALGEGFPTLVMDDHDSVFNLPDYPHTFTFYRKLLPN